MKNMKKSSLIILVVLAVLLFVVLPLTGSNYILNICTLMCLYLAMSQMWNLLGGYAGMLSLGMQAFIGIGGYTLTILSVNYGVNIFVSILIGAVICAVFGLAVSPAIFKMSGVYFAIGTWIIAEALNIFFSNWKFVGYAQDWSINSVFNMSYKQLYYTALVIAVIATLIVYSLLRTKTGLALMAIRDSASAAETMGVELYKTKLKCYVIACFMMGLIGGAQYMQTAFINPDTGFLHQLDDCHDLRRNHRRTGNYGRTDRRIHHLCCDRTDHVQLHRYVQHRSWYYRDCGNPAGSRRNHGYSLQEDRIPAPVTETEHSEGIEQDFSNIFQKVKGNRKALRTAVLFCRKKLGIAKDGIYCYNTH